MAAIFHPFLCAFSLAGRSVDFPKNFFSANVSVCGRRKEREKERNGGFERIE